MMIAAKHTTGVCLEVHVHSHVHVRHSHVHGHCIGMFIQCTYMYMCMYPIVTVFVSSCDSNPALSNEFQSTALTIELLELLGIGAESNSIVLDRSQV